MCANAADNRPTEAISRYLEFMDGIAIFARIYRVYTALSKQMIHGSEKTCPNCGSPKVKHWAGLNDEQKMLAERLPGSSNFSTKDRENHRFCTRCWFEITNLDEESVDC
jgi:hypothetical protein